VGPVNKTKSRTLSASYPVSVDYFVKLLENEHFFNRKFPESFRDPFSIFSKPLSHFPK
jgi:hypothetical protein